MDEGIAFVPTTPTFTVMDLEALDDAGAASATPTPDDLLFYLTTGGEAATNALLDDLVASTPSDDVCSVSPLLIEDFTLPEPYLSASSAAQLHGGAHSPLPASFSSSPSTSSPVSSPSQASPFAFSSSPCASSPQSAAGDLESSDHFVFDSWVDSVALGTGVAPASISPVQLQATQCNGFDAASSSPPSSAKADSSSSDEGSPATQPKKQTRKRKRTKKNEAPLQTAVTLPRDELLKLSSQELEDYAENLRKVRKLTAEEEKDLRRQRRLIKNRESAQLSRVRKREQMEVLEQQLQEAHSENARLKQQVDVLSTENRQLKEHIASMSQHNQPSRQLTPALDNTSAELSGKMVDEDAESSASILKMVHSWTTLGKGATATAVKATYLFVILLSIGLFFNARYVHYGPGLGPLEMGNRGFSAAYQFPASVVSSSYENTKPAATVGTLGHIPRRHRDILQVEDPDPDSTSPHRMEVVPDLANKRNERIAKAEEPTLSFSGATLDSLDAKAKPWRKEAPTFPLQSSSSAMPTVMTGEAANKTILMCPSVTPLQWPGEELSADNDEITFILPSSSASFIPSSLLHDASSTSSFSTSARHSNGGTVQLTCKVVDARTVSLSSLLAQ